VTLSLRKKKEARVDGKARMWGAFGRDLKHILNPKRLKKKKNSKKPPQKKKKKNQKTKKQKKKKKTKKKKKKNKKPGLFN